MSYLILTAQKRPDGRIVYASRYEGQLPRRAPNPSYAYWWAIDLDAEVPQETESQYLSGYGRWAGMLPENWLDYEGNLRGKDGNVIFAAGEKGST